MRHPRTRMHCLQPPGRPGSPFMMRTLLLCLIFVASPGLALGQDLPAAYPPVSEREGYYLTFEAADSTAYTSVYPDQAVRDSIDAAYRNRHRAARSIERYAMAEQDIDFLRRIDQAQNPDAWSVALTSGDTLRLDPREERPNAADFTFEHYHPEHGLIVFRSQWAEGNAYVLVSRSTGTITPTYGPPVFSPDATYFVAFNHDTISGYSPNGLQLFHRAAQAPEKVLEYDMDQALGGPTAVTWVDDHTFRVELLDERIIEGGMIEDYRHYRVRIREEE